IVQPASRDNAGALTAGEGSYSLPETGEILVRQLTPAVMALIAAACSHAPGPSTAWTEGPAFTPMGAGSGAFSAMLDGATSAAAPYTIRVHITKGGRIMPHTHPDPRVITVVDGELCYGFGA